MNPVEFYVAVGKDGNQYCALIGENLQEGICGFGLTPAEALRALAEACERGQCEGTADSTFEIGDRVRLRDINRFGRILGIRWAGRDFIYSIQLDEPIEDSMLGDVLISRGFEMTKEGQ